MCKKAIFQILMRGEGEAEAEGEVEAEGEEGCMGECTECVH